MECKLTNFRALEREAIRFLRHHDPASPWPAAAVLLEYEQFRPRVPERLWALGEWWRRVGVPDLQWTVGLGYDVHTPNRSTHLHADIPEHGVHLDLFRFVSWGPLSGETGILVSRDDVVLAAGGTFAHPPGGRQRNWPLGVVLPTGALLTVSGSILVVAPPQSEIAVAVWERGG